jgi:glycosyltransferase involved in cell wall biosynthesis
MFIGVASEPLHIFAVDGLRHRSLSGYGMLARKIILGLVDLGHDVRLEASDREWGPIESGARERLEALPQTTSLEFAELVLQIKVPISCRRYPKPSLLYTQNALGELPPAWTTAISTADGVIVPSEFDRNVFSRHVPRVYVAGQSSDPAIFRPIPGWRSEGSELFTFLFVGSYGFRKGVDVLLEAFLTEFSPDEPVQLLLQVAGVGKGDEFNHCLSMIQRLNPLGRVRMRGAEMAPEWMNRLYNQSDCVITMSRGEGWCMPLTEALLCGVPVIAPRSTAMAEYLDDSVAELVDTHELPATDAPLPFGGSFAKAYGFPGVTYYEPDVAKARQAMRRVYRDHPAALRKAQAGRSRVLSHYSWQHTARAVERACRSLMRGDPPGSSTIAVAEAG